MSFERINSTMPFGKTILKYRWFFLCGLIRVLFDSVLWHVVRQMPYWGDEIHFVGTIQYFGHDFSWRKLVYYNEETCTSDSGPGPTTSFLPSTCP